MTGKYQRNLLGLVKMSAQDVIRLSAKTVGRQLNREGYCSRTAVHEPLITKMNAHLRVQWLIWSDESSTIFLISG
uniref:Transposase Tc1-like domain-containing protein n=1 Tax=Seriola lalandi dorsalis TaxID=1841481 RepID=A0A3B4W9L4_SERLL